MIFSKPSNSLRMVNSHRAISYIIQHLESLEIEEEYDRTKLNNLKRDLKVIITNFLESLRVRRGIIKFKISNILIGLEDILIKLDIDTDYDIYELEIRIPFTSKNYGLK